MTLQFEGRTALITGGSKGIGKEIALNFARQGARIAIIDIDEEGLNDVRTEFSELGYDIISKKADVVNEKEINQLLNKIIKDYKKIDILVNNAGIIRDNLLYKMTDSDWEQVMDVHLKGSFNVTRAAQKYMVLQKYGRIINISSTSALGNRGQANYATAKAGLQGLTKTLAIELGKYGITSNCVAPGFIETEMTKSTAKRVGIPFSEFVKKRVKEIPVARSGTPFDIANAVAFFADEKSSFVNGQIIYVAGGPRG